MAKAASPSATLEPCLYRHAQPFYVSVKSFFNFHKISRLLFPALLMQAGLSLLDDYSFTRSKRMSQNQDPSSRPSDDVKMILVVEDDAGIGTFLVQAITQETPYLALLVSDGFQALNAVANVKPSLFILDYQLPRMNGIELYDKLHATKEMENVPAVVISARLPRKEIEQRKIIGMSKPLELDDLLQTIEQLLA
jgi:CheY-like chemotaxis protein